ncbi:MAG: DUF4097 domain-containing protein [Chloroflexi bacterium]|nr:DUF4097 domain-containing protein [Chloroflexota bacterium]
MNAPESPRQRSLFWPVILIGIGVILLLANLNIITTASLAALAALWPLLLVALGLEILFGQRSTLASGLIALLMVGAVIFILVAGPKVGLNLPTAQVMEEQFSEPVGQAHRADVLIDISSDPVTIDALSGSGDLIQAAITHTGEMEFTASGSSDKSIVLRKQPSTASFHWGFNLTQPTRWDIALSPQVPLDLTLQGGSGSTTADLSRLQLERLNVDVASGSFVLDLPDSEQAYEADVEGGSGSLRISLPADTDLTLSVTGNSGSINLQVPANTEYRIEVLDSGSGSLSLPRGMDQVEEGDDDEGIWETPGYARASRRMLIRIVDIGSGSVTID